MTTATPRKSSAHIPVDVPLVQYRDGTIYAMSLSEPSKVYRIEFAPLSCACPGFQHRGQCCHSSAAAARFGGACAWCGEAGDVQAFRNGFDGDAVLTLCAACLRDARAPRSFWAALQPVGVK